MQQGILIEQIAARVELASAVDAAWCQQQLRKLQQRLAQDKPVGRELQGIFDRVDASAQKVAERKSTAPKPAYDPALPITAHREEILRAVSDHPIVIIAGETGSGKTTQLPKLCLEAGFGSRGQIGCTQPRRIAASAMAQRVAEELHSEIGQVVGYQVRFRDRSGPECRIKFMTDGILLAETLHDPDLAAYDAIIIDEAHERSLNIDFLLGYLKLLVARRPELRVVITSATIDTEKFSRHFNAAPVIEISGRGYPVELIYQPLDAVEAETDSTDRDLYQGIADAVRKLGKLDAHGDILVFLSGEREIREAGDFLGKQRLAHTEILPLYARLSASEQQRVFHPGPQRRIILSTNVAETSLTVPRIRFVVDSGMVRMSRYAHRSRIQRLPIEPVAKASANQRMGRCGRLGPGTCVRLYSEEDFLGRPDFTEPEILRTSLGSVILRMLVMGLGVVEEFPFIDSPAPRMINDAYSLLLELGAIDPERKPTELGRQLDAWPVDVRLARMLVAGDQLSCLEDVLVLASALSIQDPRERPLLAQQQADQSHQRFRDEKSDFASLLRLWDYLRGQRHTVSGNQFRKLCSREFLSWQRVLEWFDLYQQLRDQARESGLRLSGKHGDYAQVHQALLTGLLSHVGHKHVEDKSYQGARSLTFHIFPGSGLFGHTPKWLMAAEIVETTRPWARINAEIQPEWIERQGAHLLKHHYMDPHWSRKRGTVMAWEQVSLFGLVVVERRRLQYGRIDPVESRRIFILEALVRGELDTRAAFLPHNQKIREEVELLEHKRRRHDVLTDEHNVFEFFDARIPQDVHGSAGFEKWLRQLGEEGRKSLYLGHDVLMREGAAVAPEDLFPDVLRVDDKPLQLVYHFEPGHLADGVTVRVPLQRLNTLDSSQLQWLVPGLLREKLTALIRALPKPMRRVLTPVPVFAEALHGALHESLQEEQRAHKNQPLLQACAAKLSRMTGVTFEASHLDEAALPAHLRMRIQVVDDMGNEIAQGRSLEELQFRLGHEAQRKFMDEQGAGFNRDGLTAWEVGSLPERVISAGGQPAYPALVDQNDCVGLRLFDTPEEAATAHTDGVLRLCALALTDKISWLRKHHGLSRASLMAWSPLGLAEELIDDLLTSSLQHACGDCASIRSEQAFAERQGRLRSVLGAECTAQAALLDLVLPVYSRVGAVLQGPLAGKYPGALEDVRGQMKDLVYQGFLPQLLAGRLQHYPRYFAAIEERLRALQENPKRDAERMRLVQPWWERYLHRLHSNAGYDLALDEYRWLLEEYRVSLFAQRLGTAAKVSEKRLAAAWQNVLA